MEPKDFLIEECANVGHCLDQTLRFEYGGLDANIFYGECTDRLEKIKKDLNKHSAHQLAELGDCSRRLSDLSSLISRMERAHVDEVSWPFAEEIINLATPLCTETQQLKRPDGAASSDSTSHDGNTNSPIFPILAEGGLNAYCIFTEENENGVRATRRAIHTIIFPRSLKYHVLLHAVIAHEIGHAALSEPEVAWLLLRASQTLLHTGILKNPDTLQKHLNSTRAPGAIKEFIKSKKRKPGSDPCVLKESNLRNWRMEFLCDLIGLLLIGPSFIPAFYTILRALNPLDSWGTKHPPFYSRLSMLQQACKYLDWNKITTAPSSKLYSAEEAFWKKYLKKPSPWFNFFDAASVNNTVDAINQILAQKLPQEKMYSPLPGKTLNEICKQLIDKVPPTPKPTSAADSLNTPNRPFDFRHLLFGGWIVWNAKKSLKLHEKVTFEIINRFCHLAVLQNRAIKVYNDVAE